MQEDIDDSVAYRRRKEMVRNGVPKALVQGDGDEGSTVEWQTDEKLFDALDLEFGPFTLDPATALGYHTSDVILNRGGTVYVQPQPAFEYIVLNGGSVNMDGLNQNWTGRVYLNHPYGRADWRWMKKARDSVREGDADIVVALVPVKTGMRWWQLYVAAELERGFCRSVAMPYPDADRIVTHFKVRTNKAGGADIVRFLPGRQRFGGAKGSAPFNSAVIVWRK